MANHSSAPKRGLVIAPPLKLSDVAEDVIRSKKESIWSIYVTHDVTGGEKAEFIAYRVLGAELWLASLSRGSVTGVKLYSGHGQLIQIGSAPTVCK
jgi:hypothetical protein